MWQSVNSVSLHINNLIIGTQRILTGEEHSGAIASSGTAIAEADVVLYTSYGMRLYLNSISRC
jgi:hypothetical protein